MLEKLRSRFRGNQNILIVLAWLVYTCSYSAKYSYSATVNSILLTYGVTKTETGLVGSCMFFSYGIGQVVNAFLCKYYNKRTLFPLVLTVAGVLNLAIYLGIPFTYFKYLWVIDGFVLSTIWSSLVMTLSDHLDNKHMDKALLVLSTTTSAGTLITYGYSALFSALNIFKTTYLLGFLIPTAVAVIWIFLYWGEKDCEKFRGFTHQESDPIQPPQKTKLTMAVLLPVILMGVCAVAGNFVKDGLQTWVPNILLEVYGISDSVSLLMTVGTSLLGMLGGIISVKFTKILPDFVATDAIYFGVTTALIGVILMTMGQSWAIFIVCFGLTNMMAHAINSTVTSVGPISLRDKLNPGKLAGILNGCCYVGSTLCSVGLGAVADKSGWEAVFKLFFVIALLGTLTGIIPLYKKLAPYIKKLANKN